MMAGAKIGDNAIPIYLLQALMFSISTAYFNFDDRRGLEMIDDALIRVRGRIKYLKEQHAKKPR